MSPESRNSDADLAGPAVCDVDSCAHVAEEHEDLSCQRHGSHGGAPVEVTPSTSADGEEGSDSNDTEGKAGQSDSTELPGQEAGGESGRRRPTANTPHCQEANTSLLSVGSLYHPNGCRECQFFFFGPEGCVRGADCCYCHEVHPRRNARRNRKYMKRLVSPPCEQVSLCPPSVAQKLGALSIRDLRVSVLMANPLANNCALMDVSGGFEELTGHCRKEVVGRSFRQVVSRRRRDDAPCGECERLHRALGDGGLFVGMLPSRKKSGEEFMSLVHVATVLVFGCPYVIGIQADVTHRGAAAKGDPAQEEEEEELEAAVTWVLAQSGRFLSSPEGYSKFVAKKYRLNEL